MSPKISVLVIIYRPGYIDSMTEALRNQTFKDFEWILVDDLWEQRKEIIKEYVGGSLNLKHIPPREIKPYATTCLAGNTGFIHAEGKLIYIMPDYIYPHPRVLERHWEIYSKYGPKVTISGPLIDAIVASGRSVWAGASPMTVEIKNDEGEIVTYPEYTPPISFPLKDNFEEPTPENLISIFKEPFKPTWPETVLPDWRLGHISKVSIEKNLCENDNPDWFWGRNDSAPLEALLDINGLDEAFDGRRGGADADLGARLMKYGCRLLVDREAPCYMLPHPVRKRANISEEDRLKRVAEKRKIQPIPNDYSLRAERAKLGLGRAEEKKGEPVLKILCISTAIYPVSAELRYGGIERLCFLISEELNRRGFKVSVAAPEGSSFPKGITHINTGPCGDFIEGERKAYYHYNHLLNEFDAIISFDHRHFAMLGRDLPAIALIWHTPSIMQFPLPSYNIASLSEFQKRELQQYQGLKSRLIDPHCVDPRAYLPQENDNGRYLFIGRLNPEKGVRDAVKLCRELGVGLDIIGGLAVGDPSEYLEWVERNCDPEQIVYRGNIPDKVKFEFIAKAKALLHTVNYPEVSSHKSIEAICGGLPVIAYDIGANGEIIEHKVTGFIARDENDFKECMAKAGGLNKELIRERGLKRWSVEATVGRFIPVVKEVAKGIRW